MSYSNYYESLNLNDNNVTTAIETLAHYLNFDNQLLKKSRFLGIMYGNYTLHNLYPVCYVANSYQLEYYRMTPYYLFDLEKSYFELCIKSTFYRLNGRNCILQIEFFHQLVSDDDFINNDGELAEKLRCFVNHLITLYKACAY